MNNYSKQRELILEVIKNNLIHPTAEEIYNLVIKEEPTISKSTVYRNINILLEQGEIIKITMSIGPDRYDYMYEQHQHAICKRCGKVYDFSYNFNLEVISNIIKEQTEKNFEINNITIDGICEKCKS
ncbi:MAG: transcriptional repressor [Clostridia bacterium]|nr:transcriptional repressor [Clostridia bacterium]